MSLREMVKQIGSDKPPQSICEDCRQTMDVMFCVALTNYTGRHITCLRCSPELLDDIIRTYLSAVPDPNHPNAVMVIDAMRRYALSERKPNDQSQNENNQG